MFNDGVFWRAGFTIGWWSRTFLQALRWLGSDPATCNNIGYHWAPFKRKRKHAWVPYRPLPTLYHCEHQLQVCWRNNYFPTSLGIMAIFKGGVCTNHRLPASSGFLRAVGRGGWKNTFDTRLTNNVIDAFVGGCHPDTYWRGVDNEATAGALCRVNGTSFRYVLPLTNQEPRTFFSNFDPPSTHKPLSKKSFKTYQVQKRDLPQFIFAVWW